MSLIKSIHPQPLAQRWYQPNRYVIPKQQLEFLCLLEDGIQCTIWIDANNAEEELRKIIESPKEEDDAPTPVS